MKSLLDVLWDDIDEIDPEENGTGEAPMAGKCMIAMCDGVVGGGGGGCDSISMGMVAFTGISCPK